MLSDSDSESRERLLLHVTDETPLESSMFSDYLVLFAQVHDEFRIPELLSVSELFKFKIGFPSKIDTSRPFMILSLESEEHAILLATRCILVK